MENPIKMYDLGVKPTIFGNIHIDGWNFTHPIAIDPEMPSRGHPTWSNWPHASPSKPHPRTRWCFHCSSGDGLRLGVLYRISLWTFWKPCSCWPWHGHFSHTTSQYFCSSRFGSRGSIAIPTLGMTGSTGGETYRCVNHVSGTSTNKTQFLPVVDITQLLTSNQTITSIPRSGVARLS